MTITWDEFESGVTDKRFLFPVWDFDYRVQYVPVLLNRDSADTLMNHVSGCVVDILRHIPSCPLSSLRVTPGKKAIDDLEHETGEYSYFVVSNTVPVFDFVLQFGPSTFRLYKLRSSLRDLIETVPILEEITTRLFSPAISPEESKTDAPRSIIDMLQLGPRLHRVSFTIEHRLRLTNHITENHRDALNTEIIDKMVRNSSSGSRPEQDSPITAVQPESFLRGDINLSMEKTFGDRKRIIWISAEAPFNISQRDIDLEFSYRCGEGRENAIVEASDLTDWTTPLVTFYRDMIINRFLPGLFFDINVETRIA